MKTSSKGLELIKKYEGCRLTAYRCPAGVLTIGYGHTGPDVKEGMTITQKKAETLLKKDLAKFEKHVLTYKKKYNWNQNQFDAMVSFAYNVGSLYQLTNNGERTIEQISAKITAYNKAAGKVLEGLARRRAEEKKLFDTPVETKTTTKEKTTTKTTSKTLKKGVKIKIKKGAKDANTKGAYASWVYETTYQVHSISGSYVIFGNGVTIVGKTKKTNVTIV